MHPLSNKAETARRNGARSKGPITAAGKARSCRNSLIHGRRAAKLADFTPPNSATLTNEDRQKFFTLFDQNLSKFRPADPAEKALVRDLTNRQWDNLRLESARVSMSDQTVANSSNSICSKLETTLSSSRHPAETSMDSAIRFPSMGGTAFPTCTYCSVRLPRNTKLSGKA